MYVHVNTFFSAHGKEKVFRRNALFGVHSNVLIECVDAKPFDSVASMVVAYLAM